MTILTPPGEGRVLSLDGHLVVFSREQLQELPEKFTSLRFIMARQGIRKVGPSPRTNVDRKPRAALSSLLRLPWRPGAREAGNVNTSVLPASPPLLFYSWIRDCQKKYQLSYFLRMITFTSKIYVNIEYSIYKLFLISFAHPISKHLFRGNTRTLSCKDK